MELDLQCASQFWAGLYERETYPWLVRFGTGCSTAVDVGAAQGEFTLYVLKRTNASRVLAFDPSDENEVVFSRNLRHNGFGGDERLIRIRRFVGSGAEGSVRLDTLEEELRSPLFVRIDVDGLEMQVLEGMAGLFEKLRVRILLESHSVELEEKCNHFLWQRRCRTRIVRNAWWRAVVGDQRPIEHNRWLVASNDPECYV